MAGIFINYRRDDAPGVAGRLFDHLATRFSKDDLFMDVDAMKPGIDFSKQLDTQVAQCRVLLAVIGPHWLDAKDKAGARRLDSDKDYVRIELASALKRDIAVIPVLVDGATMPTEENLSEDLKPLAFRHALELRHTRFNADADAIVQVLKTVVPRRRNLIPLIGAGIAAVLVIAAGGVMWQKLKTRPVAPPSVVAAQPAPVTPPAVSTPVPASAPPTSPAQVAQAPSATASPAVGVAASAGLPPGMKIGDIIPNVALRGSLYRVAEGADPPACQAACRAETRCVAWTYTQPKPNESAGRCSLKAVIPQQFSDACCSSGVERVPDPELRVPPPIPPSVTGAVAGVELEGGSYRYFPDATIEGCQAACRADNQCMAWDYVRPGIFATDARCFLKNKPSMEVQSPCCVAGFERQAGASAAAPPPPAAPASVPAATASAGGGALPNTDLHGSDYRNIVLSSDNWSLCQNACRADPQCLAWSIVHPGIQGPNARCWLKNKIPKATPNPCCTSGIERAAVQ